MATVFNLFGKDKTYSETENRMLAQKPEFSLYALANGSYMSDMEDYVTDQFFIRDKWINLKMLEDLTLGKRESNGVYIGKKKQLIEIPSAPDMGNLDHNLASIKDFSERHGDKNIVMTLAPNAASVCDQLLPMNAPVRDQSADIFYVREGVGSGLTFVDLMPALKEHKNEALYYKTDHHWTTLAARYAFDALAKPMGITDPIKDYTVYPVTHSFQGTLTSKSGYDKAMDTIEIYVPKGDVKNYVVNYPDEYLKSGSVYSSEALEQKDKYEVFFGGNHTRLEISSPVTDKRTLLVFKDSYANCFLPFLTPYYRNIIVVDPRYYYDDIDKLIHDSMVTDVLFLYNVNTFLTDNSLGDVLQASDKEVVEAETNAPVSETEVADA